MVLTKAQILRIAEALNEDFPVSPPSTPFNVEATNLHGGSTVAVHIAKNDRRVVLVSASGQRANLHEKPKAF